MNNTAQLLIVVFFLMTAAIAFQSCTSDRYSERDLAAARQEGYTLRNQERYDSAFAAGQKEAKITFYELGYTDGFHKRPKTVNDLRSKSFHNVLNLILKIGGNFSLLGWIVFYIRRQVNSDARKNFKEAKILSIIGGLLTAILLKAFAFSQTSDAGMFLNQDVESNFLLIGLTVLVLTFIICMLTHYLLINHDKRVSRATELFMIVVLTILATLTTTFIVQDFLHINYEYTLYHCICISMFLGYILFYIIRHAMTDASN